MVKPQPFYTDVGEYGFSNYPSYSNLRMAWIQSGGVYASANIRGAGEYGESWYMDGMKEKKQNCIDDLIGAAEWLIANRYTSPSKLGLFGYSHGGMLAAACANQRPELFSAVVVRSGVLDMLRYHLFTLGRFWLTEFGNPENPKELLGLKKFSPYHTIKKGTKYPSMLIATADHDDRVVPMHSYSTLQRHKRRMVGTDRSCYALNRRLVMELGRLFQRTLRSLLIF